MREIVDNQTELEQSMFDYETAGWEVEEKSRGRVVMKRGLRGGFLEHFLFFFLAPIYGNLVYSAYRRFDRPERIVLRVQGFSQNDDADPVDGGDPEE